MMALTSNREQFVSCGTRMRSFGVQGQGKGLFQDGSAEARYHELVAPQDSPGRVAGLVDEIDVELDGHL